MKRKTCDTIISIFVILFFSLITISTLYLCWYEVNTQYNHYKKCREFGFNTYKTICVEESNTGYLSCNRYETYCYNDVDTTAALNGVRIE